MPGQHSNLKLLALLIYLFTFRSDLSLFCSISQWAVSFRLNVPGFSLSWLPAQLCQLPSVVKDGRSSIFSFVHLGDNSVSFISLVLWTHPFSCWKTCDAIYKESCLTTLFGFSAFALLTLKPPPPQLLKISIAFRFPGPQLATNKIRNYTR